MDERQETAAWVSVLPAALHLFYAQQGGIHAVPIVRWLLALGTILGSALIWLGARRSRWLLAWVGLSLIILPAIPDWPAIGVSPGGQLALLLMLATAIVVAVGATRGPRPAA